MHEMQAVFFLTQLFIVQAMKKRKAVKSLESKKKNDTIEMQKKMCLFILGIIHL